MQIAGLDKTSAVDFPGRIAAVVFTPGCNFDCWYCHNRHLLAPGEQPVRHDSQDVLDFLAMRVGLLDGVVVTGGEPTLQNDLGEFLAAVQALGLATKLDTNGTRPWIVRDLVDRGLLDFVAMDIKAPFSGYDEITMTDVDRTAIEESIDLLMTSGVDYEFRTTYAPPLTAADIAQIAMRIRGAKQYALQQYRMPGHGVDLFGIVPAPEPRPPQDVYEAAEIARRFVPNTLTRGLPTMDVQPDVVDGVHVSDGKRSRPGVIPSTPDTQTADSEMKVRYLA
ncbi:MAG: anaerobic ribonucleoside-triphosphate reductase activating protein [Planctomycetes bacterium]|jgi:pyruvate formate lyase activating enzyme|nr:anaerobic ribonucleoside-triphosphate reductase activating protein [Planctomycetota bacterium]